LLVVVLGAAFLGGLILNLMPCVLPVLSLKVFSLMKHAGDDPRGAWKQGAAFTAGVVLSFWALAGLLLILKALGNQLGWGYQMQSPGFILAMIILFFLLALNLFGVFEIGTSLVGLDAKATGKLHGLTSSFLNGALATLAATPCAGPLMGGTLGFAAQQPPLVAMLVFTFIALGVASPYLVLTIFPGALRFVPKPGAWMEAFKQLMGFLLMVAVIWFVQVFGASVGADRISWLLLALLSIGLAAWIYGRWVSFDRPLRERLIPFILMLAFLAAGLKLGLALALEPVQKNAGTGEADQDGYQVWSDAAVSRALAQGRPVFVDFTAAWCLSCKVNERVALDTDAVRQAFKERNVVLLKADWTLADPEISQALQRYNRDGVPLYLLYSPKNPDAPQVLPEVLTPGIVLDALHRL
jgi:thiol:disulfide interchange protein DsbD